MLMHMISSQSQCHHIDNSKGLGVHHEWSNYHQNVSHVRFAPKLSAQAIIDQNSGPVKTGNYKSTVDYEGELIGWQ